MSKTAKFAKILDRKSALSGAVALAALSSPAAAQEAINQPLSDEYGVERKTGRALFPLPTINTVGGEGAAALDVSYQHVDGVSLALPMIPARTTDVIIPPDNVSGPPELLERYIVYTITYGSINERFRKLWVNGGYNGPIEPEYPTGSTYDGTTYTSKHGLKITFGAGLINTVEYPDGMTKTFDASRIDSAMSIKNSFGYAFKLKYDETVTQAGPYRPFKTTFQAVNLAQDYCALSSAGLCSGLAKNRQGSLEALTTTASVPNHSGSYQYWEKYVFTDAAGLKTTMRNELLGAIIQPPHCITISYDSGYQDGTPYSYNSCSNPQYGWRPYPAGLKYPGSNVETHTIDYNLQPGQLLGDTFDKIAITQVAKDGVTVDYTPLIYKPSSSYGGSGTAPTSVTITSKIDGQEISHSYAFGLHPFWGQSRRVLMYVRDANGRTTSFPFNDEWEVNGVGYPEGNGYSHEYDSRQNIIKTTYSPKANSGEVAQTVTYTYAASCSASTQKKCNKPLTMTDRNGKTTNYTYNSRGQLLTETGPAPTAGAPRPKVTNTYTMRTAYIKSSSGSPIAAGHPISLLTKSVTCRTLSSCAGSTDEVTTFYDYGPTSGLNNLKLRGVGVRAVNASGQFETLWTCFRYNYFGEKISETQPRAGLTSCP